jgi:acyl-ACP dehydrogenase
VAKARRSRVRAGPIGFGGYRGRGSLHGSAITILRRFGRSDYLKAICGGSDLQIVETEVRSARDGFEVRGVVGTDEVLWELVAAAMKPDYDGYAELIGRGNA